MARHIGLGVEEQGNGKLQNGTDALKEGKKADALNKKQKKADAEAKK